MVVEVPEEVEVLCHQHPEEVEVLCHPHQEAVPPSAVQPVRLQGELLLLHLADQVPIRPDRKILLLGVPSMAVPSVRMTVLQAQVLPIKTGPSMIPDKAGMPIVLMQVDLELQQEIRLVQLQQIGGVPIGEGMPILEVLPIKGLLQDLMPVEIQVWVMETDPEEVEPEAIGPVETDQVEIISIWGTIIISISMQVEIPW